MLAQYPVFSITDLYNNMPEIHHKVSEINDDNPALPMLVERNLEIELSILQQEHFMENETLENFPGLTEDRINFIINLTQVRSQTIADIDGRGNKMKPRPLDNPVDEDFRNVILYFRKHQ